MRHKRNELPQEDEIKNITVSLPSIAGLTPRQYTPATLCFFALVLLFILLLLPGLINYGSVVLFESEPEGAAIYLNGERIGSTTLKRFVETGEHLVEFRRPYHESETFQINLDGRRFGSLFSPKKHTIIARLSLLDPSGAADEAFEHFARQAVIGEDTANNQFEPILSVVGNELATTHSDTLATLLRRSLPYAVSPPMAKEWIRTALIYANRGRSGGTLAPLLLLREIIIGFADNNRLLALAGESLPETIAASLQELAPITLAAESIPVISDLQPDHRRYDVVEIAEIIFVGLPGGRFLFGASPAQEDPLLPPYLVDMPPFYIMQTETTRRQFTNYLSATEDNATQCSYLNAPDWSQKPEDAAVAMVNWEMATRFAQWIEKQLPEYLNDHQVRLPFEHEWEWAANLADAPFAGGRFLEAEQNGQSTPGLLNPSLSSTGAAPIVDLLGNLWEWTYNRYAPGDYIVQTLAPVNYDEYIETRSKIDSAPIISARGGSWANSKNEISISTRAAIPGDWCTPYLGFRVVIVPRSVEEI